MLKHQSVEKLRELRLFTMAEAFNEQLTQPALVDGLCFEERFGLIVDREWNTRLEQRLKRRLKDAKLREVGACAARPSWHAR